MRSSAVTILMSALLISCSAEQGTEDENHEKTETAHQHSSEASSNHESEIQLGDGERNRINMAGVQRYGPSLIIPAVTAETDSFLVLHPFENGTPVQTDYVGSTYVPAGVTENVAVRLDETPNTETPFIIMLHHDLNEDQRFQFGDGVTVPDAPVFEGSTLIAKAILAQTESRLTPEIIKTSAQEQADKAAAFAERLPYRDNANNVRARILLHSWLAEIEAPDKSVDRIDPLLAEDFFLNFSSGAITDLETLNDWLQGPVSSFEATRHVLHNVSVEPSDGETFIVNAQMSWNGLLPNGELMKARTAHRWTVILGQQDRFQIQRIDVDILEPFTFTSWKTP